MERRKSDGSRQHDDVAAHGLEHDAPKKRSSGPIMLNAHGRAYYGLDPYGRALDRHGRSRRLSRGA